MSAAPNDGSLDDILARARLYALRRWGQNVRYLKLTLEDGREQCEIVPLVPLPQVASSPVLAMQRDALDIWANGSDPKHTPDFRAVYWPALGLYRFSAKQAAVVAVLWRARFDEEGDGEVSQQDLLRAADSDSTRLRDLFARSPAWAALIVQGQRAGSYYRLAELGGSGEAE